MRTEERKGGRKMERMNKRVWARAKESERAREEERMCERICLLIYINIPYTDKVYYINIYK